MGREAGQEDQAHQFQSEVLHRLNLIDDEAVYKELIQLEPQTWEALRDALTTNETAMGVDWTTPAAQLTLDQRLLRLAHLNAILPERNVREQKDQHNVTLENHIKLAITSAGDRTTLRAHLELVMASLASNQNSSELANQVFLIWSPAAEILGWHGLKSELEEAAFGVAMPQERAAVEAAYVHLGGDEALLGLVDEYQEGIGAVVSDMLPEAQFRVEGRRKSYYSVWRKCSRDERPSYALPDFFGVRIIASSEESEAAAISDCYAAASVVTQCFTPELDRYKDYVARPKANGYQSLHLTLRDIIGARFEVQVRTEAMHDRAEHDPNTSHMAYEASTKVTPGKYFRGDLIRPHRIYRWREEVARELAERHWKNDENLAGLFPGQILAFSYDGNLHTLREGDTGLDLAFAVHSDKALCVQQINVDGLPTKFERPLQHGEVVKLSYHPKNQPTWSLGWRSKVRSSKAEKRLVRAHKAGEQEGLIVRGKEIIREELRTLGIADPLSLLTEADKQSIAASYGVPSFDIVLREIASASEHIGRGRIARWVQIRWEEHQTVTLEAATVRGEKAKKMGQEAVSATEAQAKPRVAVLNTLGCNYHLAGCCLESQGHPIVAVPSRLSGDFSIHLRDCNNLPTDGRAVESSWYMPATAP